jgi:drug/metabolite transporter (DMT)-like permease
MSVRRGASAPSHGGALLGVHVAVLLFGFAGLFGKWLPLAPGVIVFGRTVVASIALAILLRAAGERLGRFEWRFAVNGAVLALHWVAFFQAIQTATVAVALLGFASFPLFVLLLEAALLRRQLRGGEWATAALVTAGLLLVVPDFRLENRTVQGLLWGLVSGFSFALLAVCNKALAARRTAGDLAFWQNACAAICLLPAALVAPALPDARSLALLVVLGVVCTALAHTLFIRSLRALSAHTASIVAALEPVYGIALAFVLLGEIPSARTLAGGALIVGAVLLATVRASRPRSPG